MSLHDPYHFSALFTASKSKKRCECNLFDIKWLTGLLSYRFKINKKTRWEKRLYIWFLFKQMDMLRKLK